MRQSKQDRFLVGIAPISWVNDDIPGLGDQHTQDQVLAEMASIGYVSTEMGRLFMQDPPTLKAKLDEYGIQLASKFVGTLFSDVTRLEEELNSFRHWVNYLQEMGCRYVIVCEMGGSMHWDPRRPDNETTIQSLTEQEWTALVAGLHQAATICQDKGLQLVYHFHAGTVIESKEEIDRLMSLTNPELVHLLFDTGHALYGGYDPVELLDKYYERIKYVHLKDIRPKVLDLVRQENLDFRTSVLKGLFTVPGDPEGSIDFEAILKMLIERGYEGWMIVEAEQDPAVANPYQYAKMAKEYIDTTINRLISQQQNRKERDM